MLIMQKLKNPRTEEGKTERHVDEIMQHVVMSHHRCRVVLGQLRRKGRTELLQNKWTEFSNEGLKKGR